MAGDQLAYIVNHARDKVLVCDADWPGRSPGAGRPPTPSSTCWCWTAASDQERPSLGFAGERGYEELVERGRPR